MPDARGGGGQPRRDRRAGGRALSATIIEPPHRPPGPEPLGNNPIELIRFFRRFSKDPIGVVLQRFERYGDMYFTVSRGDPLYVTRHPDHCQDVLVKKASAFIKRSEDLEPFLGQGLLNSNGELWRRQRRLVQPAFSKERLEAYAQTFVRRTESRMAAWSDGQVIDLGAEMMRLTLEIVTETLFAHDIEGDIEGVAKAIDIMQEGAVDPIPRAIPTPRHMKERFALRKLDKVLNRLVEERRAQPEPGPDLLSQLVHATDEEGRMEPSLLRDEIVTLFVAGHETTSLALTWTIWLLAHHAEIRAEVEAELDALNTAPTTLADLDQLDLTSLALDEAMRLYPPAYAVPRRAKEKVEIGGYTLPEGSEIIMWIFHMHHDARWFDQAEAFIPERFRPDSGLIHHAKAYMPFGAGSRTCVGRHFATYEAKLILAALMRTFRFVSVNDEPVRPSPRITLSPIRPLMMRIERRRSAPGAA